MVPASSVTPVHPARCLMLYGYVIFADCLKFKHSSSCGTFAQNGRAGVSVRVLSKRDGTQQWHHSREFNKGLFIKHMDRVPRNQKGQSTMPGLVTARTGHLLKGQGERKESWKGFPDRRWGQDIHSQLGREGTRMLLTLSAVFCHISSPHYTSHWLNRSGSQEAGEPVNAVQEDHCPCQNKGGEKEKQGGDLEGQTEDTQLRRERQRGCRQWTRAAWLLTSCSPLEPLECWCSHLVKIIVPTFKKCHGQNWIIYVKVLTIQYPGQIKYWTKVMNTNRNSYFHPR